MTKENKELLLKYLSMALPYGVKVLDTAEDLNEICELDSIMTSRKYDKVFVGLTLPDDAIMTGIEMVKPYLRPMSSMTDEELFEVQDIIGKGVEIRDIFISIVDSSINSFTYLELQAVFEWLLKNHFDFMGLIPKDLAIEVTEENNPYKK